MTYIYRADGSIQINRDFDQPLSGEDVLPDLEFDLTELTSPFNDGFHPRLTRFSDYSLTRKTCLHTRIFIPSIVRVVGINSEYTALNIRLALA